MGIGHRRGDRNHRHRAGGVAGAVGEAVAHSGPRPRPRAGSGVIPDSITPLVGWRAWHLTNWPGDRGSLLLALMADVKRKELARRGQLTLPLEPFGQSEDLMLTSVTMREQWPARQALQASCDHSPHPAPGWGCVCGIWAFAFPEVAWRAINRAGYLRKMIATDTGPPVPVFGKVAMWGEVVLCERGFRAQFAYPTKLYVLSECAYIYTAAAASEAVESLSHYSVPVEVMSGRELEELIAA